MNKSFWVIKIKYDDRTCTYVYNKYCRHEGRTLIVPQANLAQKFSSKKAAESWFNTVYSHWRLNKSYTLEAEEVKA